METAWKRCLQGVRSRRGALAGEYWSFCAAILFVSFYLAASIYVSSRRLLWFDEIVTVLFGRLPGIAVIWKAVGHVDPWGMPPPYYILVHLFQKVVGSAEVSARLPSSLAMAVGLLIVFDCTRRLTDGLHGLIALAFLTCSFLPDYGCEARSYALCFMLAALSLWVWIHAGSVRSSAVLFSLVFFCGFMMHPYAVLWLVPYMVFELVTWRQGKLPSAKLVAGGIGLLCGVAVLSNLILIAKTGPRPFSGPSPSLAAIYSAFPEMFPFGLTLLAFVLVWIALVGPIDNLIPAPRTQAAERVSWLFLLIPPAGYLLGVLATNAFIPRYFIGALPGVAVASVCLLWRHFRGARLVAVGIVLFFAVVGARHQADALRHPESIDPYGQQKDTRQVLRLEDALQDDGKEFIVLSSTTLYLEAQFYSKHPEKYRFLASDDPRYRIPVYFADYYPLKIWSLNDLKVHGRATAQILPQPDTLDAMKKAGFLANVRFTGPIPVVYYQ